MSATTNGGAAGQVPIKRKQQRAQSGPRVVFAVVQVLDENGAPMKFDKARIKILDVDVNAERMLGTVEAAEKDHAFFIRSVLRGRTARQGNTSSVADVTQQMQAAPQPSHAQTQAAAQPATAPTTARPA